MKAEVVAMANTQQQKFVAWVQPQHVSRLNQVTSSGALLHTTIALLGTAGSTKALTLSQVQNILSQMSFEDLEVLREKIQRLD